MPPTTHDAAQTAPRSTDLLIQGLSRTGRAPCLLAVAPLTNLARAESASPGILNCAQELIVMGGALGPGNITRSAEFNFFFDPPAAQSVLAARSETRLVTLETSQSLVLTPQHVTEIVRGLGERPAVRFFQELCRFMSERDSRLSPGRPRRGFPVHDAATVAWLAYPELFKSRQCRVRVESSAGKGRGQLTETADPAAAACRIVCGVAADALLARMAADLRLLFAGL